MLQSVFIFDITNYICEYVQELNNYRTKCSLLFHYDWISIPLVYTQVKLRGGQRLQGKMLKGPHDAKQRSVSRADQETPEK